MNFFFFFLKMYNQVKKFCTSVCVEAGTLLARHTLAKDKVMPLINKTVLEQFMPMISEDLKHSQETPTEQCPSTAHTTGSQCHPHLCGESSNGWPPAVNSICYFLGLK